MFLIPRIRSFTSKRRALLTVLIFLDGEIINPYSYDVKKGLVYIIIIILLSCQPSFYLKYTKANTYLLYNIRFIPLNKYIFLYHYTLYYIRYNLLVP